MIKKIATFFKLILLILINNLQVAIKLPKNRFRWPLKINGNKNFKS